MQGFYPVILASLVCHWNSELHPVPLGRQVVCKCKAVVVHGVAHPITGGQKTPFFERKKCPFQTVFSRFSMSKDTKIEMRCSGSFLKYETKLKAFWGPQD